MDGSGYPELKDMSDALSYADAVAKSMQLLLNSLERRFEEMATTGKLAWPKELGQSTDQLKILLGKVEGQLTRMKAEGTFGQERKKTNGTGNQGNEKSLEAEGVLSADKASDMLEAVSEQDVVPEVLGKPADGDAFKASSMKGERINLRQREGEDSQQQGCLAMPGVSLVCPGVFGAARSMQLQSRVRAGRVSDSDSEWSEHVDPTTGLTFYHNKKTKVSSWTKPGEDSEAEVAEASLDPSLVEVEEEVPVEVLTSTKVSRGLSSKSLRGHMQERNRHAGGSLKPDVGHHHRSFLIDPRWAAKLFWDFFVMFVVLFDALILPFQLAFKNNNHDEFDEFWFWWTTVLFGVDIIFNFNTAIQVDDDGSRPDALLRDRKTIAIAYVKGWFAIDFFSTVPWAKLASLLAHDEGGGSTQAAKLLKVVKFLRLMRLMRMLRMAKLRKLWERVEDEIGSVLLVQSMMLVRILLIVIAICHWSACIFWMVGNPESLITDLMPDHVYEEFVGVPHWTTVTRTLGPIGPSQQTWRWIDRPTSESYIFCFYWTLGVMRTMPAEVIPVNLAERIFVLLFMFFALSAFAISVASLTQAYFKISERSRSFTDELFAVRMLLKRLKMLDNQTRRRVREYLTLMFERRRIMAKESNLLQQLPDELKEEVERAKLLQHLLRLPGMDELNKHQLAEICHKENHCAALYVMCPGDVACTMGEEAVCAWVLCAGRLQALDSFGEVMILGEESLDAIDEDCLWTDQPMESLFTVTAYTACEMLKINRDKFISIASQQEEVWRCQSSKRNAPMAQKALPNQPMNTTVSAAATVSSISAG